MAWYQELLEHSKNVGLLLIALLGGMLGYISREMSNQRKVKILRVLFAGLAATFFALLIKTVILKLGGDLEWAVVAIGVLSWMGADTTVNILLKSVLKRFGMSYGFYKVEDHIGDNSSNPGTNYPMVPYREFELAARTGDSEPADSTIDGKQPAP